MAQITLDELNRMDQRAFVAALGDIFEHAPWVAEAAHAARPFRKSQRARRGHERRGAPRRQRAARWR